MSKEQVGYNELLSYKAEDYYMRPSRLSDVMSLAPKLREIDKQEIRVLSGNTPEVSLFSGFVFSDVPLTIANPDDEPIAMMGVVPHRLPNGVLTGYIWLLGSDEILHVSRRFIRESRQWVEELQKNYKMLSNRVLAANSVHIKWLRWCGFQFINTLELRGVTYHEFIRINTNV